MISDALVESLEVVIPVESTELKGELELPQGAVGLVIHAHGNGSGHQHPRTKVIAAKLRRTGLATLIMNLLTPEEDRGELLSPNLRFDIELLSSRLTAAAQWIKSQAPTRGLPLGLLVSSTGTPAALITAAQHPEIVKAVVSLSGRADLASNYLPRVQAPTCLIVGGNDSPMLQHNRRALGALNCERRLEFVRGASGHFDEPGTMEEATAWTVDWFLEHLSWLGHAGQP